MRAIAALTFAWLFGAPQGLAAPAPSGVPEYSIEAIRYGTITSFPVAALVIGAPKGEKMDIAMVVWLIRGGGSGVSGGRNILFDSGFHREAWLKQFPTADYLRPDEAVELAGVNPGDRVWQRQVHRDPGEHQRGERDVRGHVRLEHPGHGDRDRQGQWIVTRLERARARRPGGRELPVHVHQRQGRRGSRRQHQGDLQRHGVRHPRQRDRDRQEVEPERP